MCAGLLFYSSGFTNRMSCFFFILKKSPQIRARNQKIAHAIYNSECESIDYHCLLYDYAHTNLMKKSQKLFYLKMMFKSGKLTERESEMQTGTLKCV